MPSNRDLMTSSSSHKQQQQQQQNQLLHPDVLSTENPKLLTYDFVVRSLRRRLWKAFQDDDKITALRAYQATLTEFQQWLLEEDEYRIQVKQEQEKQAAIDAAAAAASKNQKVRGVEKWISFVSVLCTMENNQI
jgi:hypothetical protein